MKKISPIILAAVFAASVAFCGCSTSKPESGTQTTTSPSVTESAAETLADLTEAATEAEQEKNIVLFEQNGIKLTYLGYNDGVIPELKFLIENNSDKSYMVSADDVSFNDCMINTTIIETVAPGKKASTSMNFFESDLKDNNIEKIEKVEFKLHCTNSDDYLDSFDSDVLVIDNP